MSYSNQDKLAKAELDLLETFDESSDALSELDELASIITVPELLNDDAIFAEAKTALETIETQRTRVLEMAFLAQQVLMYRSLLIV